MRRAAVAIGFSCALSACFDPGPLLSVEASSETDSGTSGAETSASSDPTAAPILPTSTGPTSSSSTSTSPDSESDGDMTTSEAETTGSQVESGGSTESSGGVSELCGDGTLDEGEQCDLGGNNNDNAACTTACQLAVCGDGLVEAGPEDCDDAGESAVCNADCTAASCGDGVLNAAAGESCDGDAIAQGTCDACVLSCDAGWLDCGGELADGCEVDRQNDPDHCGGCMTVCDEGELCSAGDCVGTKLAFLSSGVFGADFGGVEGADALCQQMADDAGLGGTFLAWISSADQDISVADRFTPHDGPYVLADGTQIASSWAELIDGTLDAPILLDESGNPPGGYSDGNCHGGATCTTVFTGTNPGGGAYSGQHDDCDGWSTTVFLPAFAGGDANAIDQGWSLFAAGLRCDYAARLYCFEQ